MKKLINLGLKISGYIMSFLIQLAALKIVFSIVATFIALKYLQVSLLGLLDLLDLHCIR